MDKTDPRIAEAFAGGATEVAVVITCKAGCNSVVEALRSIGIEPGTDAVDLGIISARLTQDGMAKVATSADVVAIEVDETASTF